MSEDEIKYRPGLTESAEEPEPTSPKSDDTPEPQKQPTVDTETETTTVVDTETETTDEWQGKLQEYGLSDNYEDVDTALKALREQNAYITRVQQENAALRRMASEQRTTETPKVDADAIYADPHGALRKLGFVSQEEVDRAIDARLAVERAASFQRTIPDFEEHRSVMNNLLSRYNAIYNGAPLPPDQAVELLYWAARGKKAASASTASIKADQDKKARATTSGGISSRAKKTEVSPEDTRKFFEEAPLEEIEKRVGFGEM